ncbi:MAG: NrfD/PsrC family molybdoenzyme membrane anchor subunit, partial [Candidatus Rokuibacteriota bacterium]
TVYDVPHEPRPWGWRVSAYLWTKSVAAGAALVAAVGALGSGPGVSGAALPGIALLFLVLTLTLLVVDLKRPDRFLYVLLKPNPRSWLVWGAGILTAFGLALGLWLLAALAGRSGLLPVLAPPLVALAVASAGYSAFLFAQAEGRDFWQSPLVLPHLLAAAVVAGAAAATLVQGPSPGLRGVFLAALGVHLLLVIAELFTPHANLDAGAAAGWVTHGPGGRAFWGGVVLAGTLAPAVLLLGAWSAAAAVASVLALAGLYLWEDLWVRAGQVPALS